MKCESVAKLIPLYHYGELPGEDEERLESHVRECPACARELELQRRIAMLLDEREAPLSDSMLAECRERLMASLGSSEAGATRQPRRGPWKLFLGTMGSALSGFARVRVPLGAMALVAVGFIAGRILPWSVGTEPAPNPEVYAAVRSVQPDSVGGVKITYDETRRKEVSGRADDQNIRRLLVSAAREENPAVRVESVDVLRNAVQSSDALEALLNALTHDPVAAVRLKAVEGLRPVAHDPRVRRAMAGALQSDDNPAVRTQVVDWMLANPGEGMVGIFQGMVQRESDGYIRSKYEKALKDRNASVGVF